MVAHCPPLPLEASVSKKNVCTWDLCADCAAGATWAGYQDAKLRPSHAPLHRAMSLPSSKFGVQFPTRAKDVLSSFMRKTSDSLSFCLFVPPSRVNAWASGGQVERTESPSPSLEALQTDASHCEAPIQDRWSSFDPLVPRGPQEAGRQGGVWLQAFARVLSYGSTLGPRIDCCFCNGHIPA